MCGLKLQGLFLKRQTEVSAHFAEIVSGEILTSQAMWEVSCSPPYRAWCWLLLYRFPPTNAHDVYSHTL